MDRSKRKREGRIRQDEKERKREKKKVTEAGGQENGTGS
mgnify:CR=1 FL=1